jgi:S-layer homology domain
MEIKKREVKLKMKMKKLMVPVMAGAMMFCGFSSSVSASQFKDVPKGAYYEEPINYLYNQKITGGVGDGNFGVGHEMTREDAVILIMKSFKYTKEDGEDLFSADFKDIDQNHYSHNFIQLAHLLKVVDGGDNSNFEPKRTITRAEMATMIDKAFHLSSYGLGAQSPFQDLAEVSWATEYINRLYREGITGGTSATTFSPSAKVTREDFATILYKALKNQVDYMPRIDFVTMSSDAVNVDLAIPEAVDVNGLKFTFTKNGSVVNLNKSVKVTSNGLSKVAEFKLTNGGFDFTASGTYELRIDGIDLGGQEVTKFILE